MMSLPTPFIKNQDPELFNWIEKEEERQRWGLEMIASENYASLAVREAQSTCLTNKYAEGYPHKRYYGGCEFVDQVELLAQTRLAQLFGIPSPQMTNVQPHSGSQANQAVFMAELKPGDTILGMDLSHGGHLTHGSPVNMSGSFFKAEAYQLDPATGLLNYDLIREKALSSRPQLIIAGYSAYPRVLDFAKFREIADEVGATLLVDMAHFSGLVAGGVHPSPVPFADYMTSTTHKTLRGPRGGIILTTNEDRAKKMNSKIFPGIQGGPLEHVIAAKAVAFREALSPDFKVYSEQVLKNAKALANQLLDKGFKLVTGGTDNHLVLVDFSDTQLTGKEAEIALDLAGITVNKNTVPQEKRSPFVTSGIRLGTPALTTRGMKEEQMSLIATWIAEVLEAPQNEATRSRVKEQVAELCKGFPVP